jgi:amidase
VSARTKAVVLVGRLQYPTSYRRALSRREEWEETLQKEFHKVDFIALPTLQSTPPGIPPNLKIGLMEIFMLDFQNTVPVNLAGNPAIAVPIPVHHMNVHFSSLQLVAPPWKEAELLNAGRLVEQAVKPRK